MTYEGLRALLNDHQDQTQYGEACVTHDKIRAALTGADAEVERLRADNESKERLYVSTELRAQKYLSVVQAVETECDRLDAEADQELDADPYEEYPVGVRTAVERIRAALAAAAVPTQDEPTCDHGKTEAHSYTFASVPRSPRWCPGPVAASLPAPEASDE